jgi:hypothetical protein
MAFMLSGSQRVKEWVLTWAMISRGPRFFSESFFEGQVDWKKAALMNT